MLPAVGSLQGREHSIVATVHPLCQSEFLLQAGVGNMVLVGLSSQGETWEKELSGKNYLCIHCIGS